MTWPQPNIHSGRNGLPIISDVFLEREAEWRDLAACRGVDPDLFFPADERGNGGQFVATAAKRVCNRCPVQTECAIYALQTVQRYGVWAGMSPKELRRARGQLAPFLREDVA